MGQAEARSWPLDPLSVQGAQIQVYERITCCLAGRLAGVGMENRGGALPHDVGFLAVLPHASSPAAAVSMSGTVFVSDPGVSSHSIREPVI